MIKLVYRNDGGKLEIPKEVLPANGVPFVHHFQSTDGDNLIELAGRTCYDSCSSEKTRSTPDYHKHINEVNHGSVQEHFNFTVQIPYGEDSGKLLDMIMELGNRPGISWKHIPYYLRITCNIRAINDWGKFNKTNNLDDTGWLCKVLWSFARDLSPLSTIPRVWIDNCIPDSTLVDPESPEEIWLSFYVSGVSRGLTHELVRHKYHTAVSQRSTRYVDESESDWAWHPLLQKYSDVISDHTSLDVIMSNAQTQYDDVVKILEKSLIKDGIDKFTARKQARGAARGILGNALSTELIWSASLDEIKRIISQRASEHADGEIRLLANDLYKIVVDLYPEYFKARTQPCPDGIGFSVYFIS